jgi:hypothetical protein
VRVGAGLPAYAKCAIAVGLLALAGVGAVLVGRQLREDEGAAARHAAGVPARHAAGNAGGRLAGAPPPLSEAQIRRATKEGSPDRAVLNFLYWARWGSLPSVVSAYDPRVVARVGAVQIAGGWERLGPSLQDIQPRIVGSRRGRRGSVDVTVRILRENAGPQDASFTVHRIPGRSGWYLAFDTMLEDAIGPAVASAVSRQPLSEPPAPEAQRAGAAVASKFRRAGNRAVALGG